MFISGLILIAATMVIGQGSIGDLQCPIQYITPSDMYLALTTPLRLASSSEPLGVTTLANPVSLYRSMQIAAQMVNSEQFRTTSGALIPRIRIHLVDPTADGGSDVTLGLYGSAARIAVNTTVTRRLAAIVGPGYWAGDDVLEQLAERLGHPLLDIHADPAPDSHPNFFRGAIFFETAARTYFSFLKQLGVPQAFVIADSRSTLFTQFDRVVRNLEASAGVRVVDSLDMPSVDSLTEAAVLGVFDRVKASGVRVIISLVADKSFFRLSYYGHKLGLLGAVRDDPFVWVNGRTMPLVDELRRAAEALALQGRALDAPGTAPATWGLPSTASFTEAIAGLPGLIFNTPGIEGVLNNPRLNQLLATYQATYGVPVAPSERTYSLLGLDLVYWVATIIQRAMSNNQLCAFETRGASQNASTVLEYFRTTVANVSNSIVRMVPEQERDAPMYMFAVVPNATSKVPIFRPVLYKPNYLSPFIALDKTEVLSTPALFTEAALRLFYFNFPSQPATRLPAFFVSQSSGGDDNRTRDLGLGLGLGIGLGTVLLVLVVLVGANVLRVKPSIKKLVELNAEDVVFDHPSRPVPNGAVCSAKYKSSNIVLVLKLPRDLPPEFPPSSNPSLEIGSITININSTARRVGLSNTKINTSSTATSDSGSSGGVGPSMPIAQGAFEKSPWTHQIALQLRFQSHKNTVTCLGLVKEPKGPTCLVFENAFAFRKVVEQGIPTECRLKRRIGWIRDLITGLKYLSATYLPYENRWALRYGVRVGNLFMDSYGALKINVLVDDSSNYPQVTRSAFNQFSAPELRAGGEASEASDAWFVGCIAWWLLCRFDELELVAHVFKARDELDLDPSALKLYYPSDVLGEVDEALVHKLRNCLHTDPAARPSLAEIQETLASMYSTSLNTLF